MIPLVTTPRLSNLSDKNKHGVVGKKKTEAYT